MRINSVITAVDIGTSKIVSVIAQIDEEGPINVLGVAVVEAKGMRRGQIIDIDEATGAVNASLDGAERMAGYSVGTTVVSVGGVYIESQNSRGVVAVSEPDREISQDDIDRVIEAAKAISIPTSREILHVIPRNFIVDGHEGVKDPVGMTGVRLEVDTHIITGSQALIRNLIKTVEEVGVDVSKVVFSGLASGLCVLSETEKELGVVILDIGGGTTDICVYTDGTLAHSQVLPIGARHITNDLAIGLRISLESAEKIKLFLGRSKKKKGVGEEDETESENIVSGDEVDFSTLGLPEELRKVSKKTLINGIITPRLNEIFTMVGLELKRSGFGGRTPAGLVLTGGGALTVGASESARRILSMPVRIGMPGASGTALELTGLIDEIQLPSFATVVGLLAYGKGLGASSRLPFGFSFSSFTDRLPLKKVVNKTLDVIKSFLP